MATPKPKYIGPIDRLVRDLPLPVVEVRASWNDPWRTVSGLICERIEFALAGMGSAVFRYHYGWIHNKGAFGMGPLAAQSQSPSSGSITDDTGQPITDDAGQPITDDFGAPIAGAAAALPPSFQDVQPQSLENWWVRVKVTPESENPSANVIWWYGRLISDTREHYAAGKAKRAGNQLLEAVDIKYLMTRVQVDKAYVWDTTANDFFVVNEPMTFNAFRGGDRTGRLFSPANKAIGESYFTTDFNNAELWSAKDIVDYLTDRHLINSMDSGNSPLDPTKGPRFFVDMPSGMDFIPLDLKVDGQTIYEIIDHLFSRQRGLAWFIYPTEPSIGMGFFIKVVSLSDVDVALPTGDVIKANQSPIIVDIHDAVDLRRAIQKTHHANKYQQVVVEGGKQGAVVSLNETDGQLTADWTVADFLAYVDAAKNIPGYDSRNRSDQQTLNDNARMGEQLRHVYTRFRVPDNWNGTVGSSSVDAFPKLDNDTPPEDIIESWPLWSQGTVMLPYLPLKSRVNYAIDDADLNPVGSLADNMRPFAVLPVFNRSSPTTIDGWGLSDSTRVGWGWDETRQNGGFDLACSVQVHDHQLGVSIIPHGVPHSLDRVLTWNGDDPGVPISHVGKGISDYHKVIFTVYLQAPHRVRVVWPETSEDRIGDLRSSLVVRLGDDARVDLLMKDTVLDVAADHSLIKCPVTKAIRDDRPLMLSIAKNAWLWYGRRRSAIELTYQRIVGEFELGQLVTRINTGTPAIVIGGDGAELMADGGAAIQGGDVAGEVVNSIVSSISYDCEGGQTSVRTDYAELDFSRMVL